MNLEIRNASFGYDKNHLLFDDVSFCAKHGEVVCILGPNGSGKTTLLKCILDILKLQKGQVLIDGQPITKQQRQQIAYVPQSHTIHFSYTVEETIVMGRCRYMNVFSQPQKDDYDAAEKMMERLQITHLRNQLTSQLSGGELQLVLIARALVSNPAVLIMDEPETGLDFRHQSEILKLIHEISHDENITVIFNTHYPQHALNIADRILLFFPDDTYAFGDTHLVLTEENMAKSYEIEIKISQTLVKDDIYYTIIPINGGAAQDE